MSFAWGRFSRKQLDVIANATARLNILDGSVRSGKTVASLVAWIKFVAEAPPGELLMVGKTERTLKRNILDPLEQMVGSKNFKLNRGEGEATLFGRRIYLAGANDERAEGKIRGMTLVGAYGDEITLWPESFFTMLLSRLSVPGARFIGTTNPDSPYHWLKVNYLDRAGELNLKSWHFTLEDNLNLDPAYVEALKKEYTGLWYKRFILGLWVLAEGVVYDMWDEDKHVRPAPTGLNRFIVAVDYGTNNPCTFGLYGWSNSMNPTVYLVREYWYDSRETGRQKTDAEYADDFANWLGDIIPEAIYVDPSAASFIAELRKRGYVVTEAANDVLDGIRFVATMLSQGRFFIDPSCKHTIKEFYSYVWDHKAQLKGEDKPLKQNDHAMDRNRYALYSHFRTEPAWEYIPEVESYDVRIGGTY
jgi:PBSX family phage terminase large subunit